MQAVKSIVKEILVLGVATLGFSAFGDDADLTVHALSVKEGAPLALPDDFAAQTVELNWIAPTDKLPFANVLNKLGNNWKDGVLNLKGLAATVVHPSGNQFQDGKAFVGGKTHLLVLHYNLTGGATLTPSDATFVAPDSATYPLTGAGWFYETRKPANGYSGWWTFADNGGTGTIDAAYMINVDQLLADGVIPDKSISRLVELFGGRKILPGSDGEAEVMPRNAAGQIVQTLTVTTADGVIREIVHVAGSGKTSLVLMPGDTLSVDHGSVAFRAATPAKDDWSNYRWVAVGDSLTDPSLNPVGGKYYDLLAASRGIRVAVNGKGSSGHWCLNWDGLCYSQRLRTIPPDADIVTVFGSVNDWKYYQNNGNQVPLGEPTDSLDETKSVAAYINETIKVIRENAPLARIVMMTGLYYYGVNQNYASDSYKLQAEIAKLNPDIRFIDWYEGQNEQGYDFPNANDYEFKQIDWNTYGEEFGSKYTRDFETNGSAFGHPSAAYNEEWLAPAFEIELGREIDELRKLELVPPPTEHTHDWQVSVEGATLKAVCQTAGCLEGIPMVTLFGENYKVWDGAPLEIAVDGAEEFAEKTGATVGNVVYRLGEAVLGDAPSEAGTYTASVTASLDGADYTAVFPFEIHAHSWALVLADGTFTATCANADDLCRTPTVALTVGGRNKKTADGKPLVVELDGLEAFEAATGAKVDVVYLCGDLVLEAPPVEAGDYTARVSVTMPGATPCLFEKALSVKEPAEAQVAIYLKADATGAGDGSNWDDAFTDPAAAIAEAYKQKLPVYAAQGVYVVTNAITLSDGFQVYGGFPGEDISETIDDRDTELYPTVFTGDQNLDNVWSHAVPNETVVESSSKAVPVTELTDKPLFSDGKFNPPPAYTTDYDVYFTQTKGTDTLQCFKTAADASGTIDGLSLVAFGATSKTQSGSGICVTKPSGTTMVTVTVRNVKFIGTMSAGGCLVAEQSTKLTLDTVGCSFMYIGSFYNSSAGNLVASLKSKGVFRDCRIESVLRKPGNGAAAGVAVMTVGQPTTRNTGIDVTGCTFCRCATVSGVNNGYGGMCNVFSYGSDAIQGTAFCNNTISNCYTAATGAGQIALMMFTYAGDSKYGANNSGTFRWLRFENNLSLVKTAANACYTMVGMPYGGDFAARYSLSDSVFRGNRIHAYATAAAAGDTVALAIAGSNSTAPAMFTMVNCVFDANEATVDETSHADVTAILCRGVANAQYPGDAPAATACMGLANCTFTGPAVEGVYEVIQTGVHSNDSTLVNCLFDRKPAMASDPWFFSSPDFAKTYSCSVDSISVDGEYRPTSRPAAIFESATVVTNKAAVVSASSPASNYPVTYSFTPYGEEAALPLCPALRSETANIGVIADLYGVSRKSRNVRGAVQKSRLGFQLHVR